MLSGAFIPGVLKGCVKDTLNTEVSLFQELE